MEAEPICSAVVNGALGSVGLALTEYLLKKGIKTYAVAEPGNERVSLLPEGAVVIPLDMREIERLPQIIHGDVDAFFHLAWMGTIGKSRDDMDMQTVNIQCSLGAVRAAEKLKSKVFIGIGSQAENGRIEGLISPDTACLPLNGYGIAKLCAGQMTRIMCRSFNIRHIWARILSVYGPYDSPLSVTSVIMDTLAQGKKPLLTAGEQMWDYLYVDDAAEALYLMALKGRDGAVYPLGSGQARPLREYFRLIRDAVDPSLPIGLGELPYSPNQVMLLQADLSALHRDTGFAPKVSFEEGIQKTAAIRLNRAK